MARTDMNIKLLNSDGSVNREYLGPREMATLIAAAAVFVSRHKQRIILRMKPDVLPSPSEASACMPTIGEMCQYAERQNCPEEIKAKVESCRSVFHGVYMDLREAA